MTASIKPFATFLILLILSIAGFLVWREMQTLPQKASLTIETPWAQAEAYLDEVKLGQTPLERRDELNEGDAVLKLVSGEKIYQTKIKLTGGTQTNVRQEFAPSESFSGGFVAWFEKSGQGAGFSVTSEPDGAKVKIDGAESGETPYVNDEITDGEHEIVVEKDGFEGRKLNIKPVPDHELHLSIRLALNPLAPNPTGIDSGSDKIAIKEVIRREALAFSDQSSLTAGTLFWIKSRGAKEKPAEFDYFLDSGGNLYTKEANPVNVVNDLSNFEKVDKITLGYLDPEAKTLSDKAKTTVTEVVAKMLKTPPIIEKAKIVPTGTGWLRVRNSPSLSGAEIARVNVGEKFPILGEEAGWTKIKLPDGAEGYVNSDFIEKLTESP